MKATNRLVLDHRDITPISRVWGSCLLGRFAGRFPGKDAINNLLKRWPCKSRVTYHRKGWLCFQFGSDADREAVRQKGPFEIFGIPLVLQPMPEKFDPNMDLEVHVPLWIRLVDLPLALWNLTAVSKIASCFGTAVATDFGTLRRETLDGPRVQVIVNTSVQPKTSITVEMPGGHYEQRVEFEFFPKFCKTCKIYGHFAEDCRGRARENSVTRTGQGRNNRQRSISRRPWVQQGRPARPGGVPGVAQGTVVHERSVLGEGPSRANRSRSRTRKEWRAKDITPAPLKRSAPTRTPDEDVGVSMGKGAQAVGIPSSPNRFEALVEIGGGGREDPHLENVTMEPLPVGPNDQIAKVTELLTAALSPILAGLKPKLALPKPRSTTRRDPRPRRMTDASDSDFPQMPSSPAPALNTAPAEVPQHIRATSESWGPAAETIDGIMAETSATDVGTWVSWSLSVEGTKRRRPQRPLK